MHLLTTDASFSFSRHLLRSHRRNATNKTGMRRWNIVHKWSSLVCTGFILVLCVSGLPLIFRHEIDSVVYGEKTPRELPPDTPAAPLKKVLESGLAVVPDGAVRFLVWDRDDSNVIVLSLAKGEGEAQRVRDVRIDARTAEVLDIPDVRGRVTFLILRLHTELFTGETGKLLLGGMGLLLVIATVSGVVLYGPSMTRLRFAEIRTERRTRIRWLDWHNLIGIATVAWVGMVAVTGVLNAVGDLLIDAWRSTELADMLRAHDAGGPATSFTPLEDIMQTARERFPAMQPAFLAFPGSPLAGPAHYMVFLRGDTALTSRLLQPVLVSAADASLADARSLPWYMTALLLAVPLHFGNYGGLPLKIVWVLLDLLTILILVSGLVLWFGRWRSRKHRSAPLEEARSRE